MLRHVDTKTKKIREIKQVESVVIPDQKRIILTKDETHCPVIGQNNQKNVNSIFLLQFSRQHGKMQIINRNNEHYCLFTNSDGVQTRVDFTPNTENLRSKEISENKFQLCVNQLDNGRFVLDFVEDKI